MRVSISRSSVLRQSLALVVALSACADAPTAPTKSPLTPLSDRESRHLRCDADNGGITLPSGFCAVVVADIVIDGAPARARHMAVTPSGDVFVGWGAIPYYSEFDRSGRVLLDASFGKGVARITGPNQDADTYRAYRFPWSGTPRTLPAIAAVPSGRTVTVYAS